MPKNQNMPEAGTNGARKFIEVRDLVKSIGTQEVLRGVSLDVYAGETLVIIGASGVGKSVLLKHILGLMRPDSGSVEVDGVCISSLPERKLMKVRKKLGILFQDGALFDSLNVERNVWFPLREAGLRDRKKLRQRALETLEVVGLEKHLHKMPIELSGGMRKRVGLARAIITKPACVLYDEPTSGLDPIVADSINHLIRHLQRQLAVTSVVVTHDMKSVYHVADRVAYLLGGRIHFLGTPEELRASKDPQVEDFIEGRARDFKEAPWMQGK